MCSGVGVVISAHPIRLPRGEHEIEHRRVNPQAPALADTRSL
jgi:hypothetical protein